VANRLDRAAARGDRDRLRAAVRAVDRRGRRRDVAQQTTAFVPLRIAHTASSPAASTLAAPSVPSTDAGGAAMSPQQTTAPSATAIAQANADPTAIFAAVPVVPSTLGGGNRAAREVRAPAHDGARVLADRAAVDGAADRDGVRAADRPVHRVGRRDVGADAARQRPTHDGARNRLDRTGVPTSHGDGGRGPADTVHGRRREPRPQPSTGPPAPCAVVAIVTSRSAIAEAARRGGIERSCTTACPAGKKIPTGSRSVSVLHAFVRTALPRLLRGFALLRVALLLGAREGVVGRATRDV
jgi:hypothetical protein